MVALEQYTPSPSSEETLSTLAANERTLWCLLAVALLADAILTWYGLQQGLTEANPVMAGAMAWLGVAGGITVVKGSAVLVAFLARVSVSPEVAPVVPLAMAITWGLAALINALGLLTV